MAKLVARPLATATLSANQRETETGGWPLQKVETTPDEDLFRLIQYIARVSGVDKMLCHGELFILSYRHHKHLPHAKVPLQVNFLDGDILLRCLYIY